MDGHAVHVFYIAMKNYGFIRTAAAVPSVRVADPGFNTEEICRIISEAQENQVSLLVFPELCITGCTCGDLFKQSMLLKGAEEGIRQIVGFSTVLPLLSVSIL